MLSERNKNKKSNQRNYVSRNKSTKASPMIATANITINIYNATTNLLKLTCVYAKKEDYFDTRGFIYDLREALGITDREGASKYGLVHGNGFDASIALSNHHANAQTYIDANSNYSYNLRLMIQRRYKRNRFKPHPDVKLDEFVYFGQDLAKCEKGNPYVLIIESIIDFLQSGKYEDKTGIARINHSP